MNHTTQRALILALLVAGAVTFAAAPEANADRRSSLGGNLLIEDPDDVFFFPHRALDHVRLFTMDLGLNADFAGGNVDTPGASNANGLTGNAGLIIGDKSLAFGVFARRSDFVNNLPTVFDSFGDIDSLLLTAGNAVGNPGLFPAGDFNGAGFSQPAQWLDVVTAFDLGGSPLGIRLSIAHARDNAEQDNDGTVNSTEDSATAVNLVVGYGIRGDMDLDLSAEIGFGFQSLVDDPDGDAISEVSSSNFPSISLMARGKQKMAKGVDLGFVGLLDFRSVTIEATQEPGDVKSGTSSSTLGLQVGAGPVYHIKDRFTIAAYATVGLRNTSTDPETNSDSQDDESSDLLLVLPQMRLSGEFWLLDWLILRTGAQFIYAFNLGEQQLGENAVANTSSGGSVFRWISGLGFDLGDMDINATLNHDFLLNGPNFIGGQEGMAVMLGLTYDFN